ncbi:uncharacterized protein LOC111070060 [Drosophila obscura]|uniref:uncharacterized protein LOC111070060 n=1 Tax=Drosophila obscura TaxID=7282 RepID=UPI000BA154EA|nr:uncharacterized protein LOC111070060 [Drosophila obscura]
MDQEMARALSEKGEQNDGDEEMPSVWKPQPGCNPVEEKAVQDLLVWEKDWNEQVMKRNKMMNESCNSVTSSPQRKRMRSNDTSDEPTAAFRDLPPWEEEWDGDLESLGLVQQTTEELTSPIPGCGSYAAQWLAQEQAKEQAQEQAKEQPQGQEISQAIINKKVPGPWDWLYEKR